MILVPGKTVSPTPKEKFPTILKGNPLGAWPEWPPRGYTGYLLFETGPTHGPRMDGICLTPPRDLSHFL